ncbi:MAG: 2-C-methyl-D-erythritol 4-phosphate cytidylyltransferase [Armatimonadota bacterium]|nr:2-C-methyl-D-erythritol 4-phosphate cytidylyltransferase [Armatimonadota bacterium]
MSGGSVGEAHPAPQPSPDRVGAVIAAAGAGSRLTGATPKPFIQLGGSSILERTLAVFEGCRAVDDVAVVVAPEFVRTVQAMRCRKMIAVVPGGRTRRDSVAAGLEALGDVGWVLVHDGVRPFVTPELIARVLEGAKATGAATAGLPVTDTLKHVAADRVTRTVDRTALWAIQTPQAFRAALIREAHAVVPDSAQVTDDAELVERIGHEVAVVVGDPLNVKITMPHDLDVARRLVEATEVPPVRVGIGYDIHRLVPDRALVLGGITIPHPRGLAGHSDADVLTHAIMDALLGAAGERDIGHHFPPDDPAYRGASSMHLLRAVADHLGASGWAVANVDAVVIAQSPRLSPHIVAMRERLAAALSVTPGQVGIKATTGEGLDAVGRSEAIAAHAVAVLRKTA